MDPTKRILQSSSFQSSKPSNQYTTPPRQGGQGGQGSQVNPTQCWAPPRSTNSGPRTAGRIRQPCFGPELGA